MVAPQSIPQRRVEISVGPGSGQGRNFKGLYAEFMTKSWGRKKPNEGEVKIWNLSESSIKALDNPGLVLRISAGETVPGQLFLGAVSRDGVFTRNQGPDWVTTIKAADGRRAYRDALFARSYPPGTALNVIISDIASAMNKPVTISATLPDAPISTGWTFAHKARSVLDEILLPYGLTWSIINGVLYILDPLRPIAGNAPVISPETGLHGSPTRTKKGVKLTTKLNPAIIAGKAIVLRSRMLSGTYRVSELMHQGDTYGVRWLSQVQGVKI